jgi:hypothetical protein
VAITSADIQAWTDSIAKHIRDQVALIGSTGAILTGQATTLNRIAAKTVAVDEYPYLDGFEAAVANENAWLSQEASYNAILDIWYPAVAGIDRGVGGLDAYCAANTIQVDPVYADAHNRAVAKGNQFPSVALRAFNVFGTVVANMGQDNVSGSGTGAFVSGAAIPAAYGNAPLQIFNTGGGNIGAASAVYTVTYSKYNAAGVLLVGQTATATMPSGSIPGFSVALSGGAAGIAVTNITQTLGTNGDQVAVKSTLLRAASY